jgi:3-oxoacyl-[acyl-carrier protein] reductase
MGKLSGKVAIITGAASGFGEAMARTYAAEGARVAILDRRVEAAQATAASIGASAMAVACDVTMRKSVEGALAAVTAQFGVADIIVNNAGMTHPNQSCLETDEAVYDAMFDVNVKAIFHMVQAAVPAMKDKGGGLIINIGSVAGLRPRSGLVWYSASKGAVGVVTRALAFELAQHKIRVNALCPAVSETALFGDFIGGDTPENRKKFLSVIPLGRFCKPQDVADAALYLATADFITGVELPVDGGRCI